VLTGNELITSSTRFSSWRKGAGLLRPCARPSCRSGSQQHRQKPPANDGLANQGSLAGDDMLVREWVGRQASPWIRQATAFPHPGHLKRSLPLWFRDHGGLSIGTCKASSLKSTGWRPRRGNVTGCELALPALWSITASSLSMICRAHDLGRKSLAVLYGLMRVVNCRAMTDGDRAARRAGVWPADLAANCQTRRRSTGCLAHRDGRVFWVTSTARA
jgi:hypothetical protein